MQIDDDVGCEEEADPFPNAAPHDRTVFFLRRFDAVTGSADNVACGGPNHGEGDERQGQSGSRQMPLPIQRQRSENRSEKAHNQCAPSSQCISPGGMCFNGSLSHRSPNDSGCFGSTADLIGRA